jgi:hypothetical protein
VDDRARLAQWAGWREFYGSESAAIDAAMDHPAWDDSWAAWDANDITSRERYARVLETMDAERESAPASGKQKKPRHRPPDPIPEATVKRLMWELAQRKARPRDRELTQEKIASRVELHPTRVQQAEALERVGWDLLRSHPEFSVNDGFVRWPNARKAAQLLASKRAAK